MGASMKILIILIVLFLSGCAALFKGTTETVEFTSDPSGAMVYVNGVPKGKAPLQLRLESKKSYDIEFRMSGYDPIKMSVTNRLGAGWVILDVLGGLIPIVIDAATGAWYGLDQNHINATFEARADDLFTDSMFEPETKLPSFRKAVPEAGKYTDEEVVIMFRKKFSNLRDKSDEEIIQMIEKKYARIK